MNQQRIKLFQGTANDCSYLSDQQAINIYADPHHPQPATVYNQLIMQGFRRSGEFVYKPGCTDCSACVPVRIVASEFSTRRVDRRNLTLNQDLDTSYVEAKYTDEYFDLYRRYLDARHPDGGMDNPEAADFERFLLNPWGETLFVSVRLKSRCVAIAVTDATPSGLSAVYTFFDPALDKRSLGRYCILQQIELCRKWAFPYLYLGYWVNGCQKMQYKTDYRPQEHFENGTWRRPQAATGDKLHNESQEPPETEDRKISDKRTSDLKGR